MARYLKKGKGLPRLLKAMQKSGPRLKAFWQT